MNDSQTQTEKRSRAMDLIRRQKTMTLSTSTHDAPWSAPVYYLFHNKRFYFFSSPDSLHIRQSESNNRAAASIFADADTWQSILGIQMPGSVSRVTDQGLGLNIIARYFIKYPFTKNFFSPAAAVSLDAFKEKFKARLYCFVPEYLLFMDNMTHFGSRIKIYL